MIPRKENRLLSSWDELESSRPLPVRFHLYASRRTNKTLCPCLVVRHCNVSVIRILDPEHRQPYISLDSIFLLSSRSIPLGILEFDLSREAGDYDLTLAGLEPREALWVPLKVARRVAEQVGLLDLLSTLLDWDNRHIWSLDEGEAGLVHNWRALQIDADSYSTGLLIQTELKNVSLLPKSQQVRTLLSQEQRQGALQRLLTMTNTASSHLDSPRSKYEQRLLRWSVLACEELLRSRRDLHSGTEEEEEEHFTLDSSDMLLLFDDYLKGLDIETKLESVSVDSEEILIGKTSQTSLIISKDEVYRRARVHVILIHHLWTLTMSQIEAEEVSASSSSTQAVPIKLARDDLQKQIDRLEASCKRSEWGVSELLTRKSLSTFPSQVEKQPLHLPYLGVMDFRFLLALIFGILLGAMTSRM